MKWFLSRLSEPSTHAAIAAILATATQFVPPPYNAIVGGIAGLFGLIGASTSESGSPINSSTPAK